MTTPNIREICRNCEHLIDPEDPGCQIFESREAACRLGECRIRDRIYWQQLAAKQTPIAAGSEVN